jgi:hypothetical protein
MNTTPYIMLLVLLGTLFGVTPLPADEPGKEVALVTAVSGQATVKAGEEESPLKLGMRLRLGDEIAVAGGKVSLVFLGGDFVSIKDGETLKLGATLKESSLTTGGATRGLGVDDATSVGSNGLGSGRSRRVWQAQLASVSGIRGDGMPIAVAPRLALAGENPRFYWFDTDTSSGEIERRYLLVLKNEENTVIAREQVRGTAGRLNSFRFARPPQGFDATARMHYQWSVLPDGAAVPEGRLDAGFVFVDQAGMDAARARMKHLDDLRASGGLDETSYHMLHCALLLDERERLCSDGLPHLLALAALPGGEEYAGEQLAQIFLRFGNQVSALAPLFHSRPGAYLGK